MKKTKPKKRNPPRTRLDHIDPDGTVWFAPVPSSEEAKQKALIKILSGDNPMGIDAFTGSNLNKFT